MDILVTAEGEVAAVDAQIAAHGSGGYQLSTGAIYPPGVTLVQDVTIPNELAGKRLSYSVGVFNELPAHIDSTILAAKKAELILKIDADADTLIVQIIGQKGLEYLEAEKQANAYIAANYLGTVPPYVQNWATVKGQTSQWAANNIAATAMAWRNAADSLRFNRLQHKENIQNATSIAGLDIIYASWLAFLAGLNASLGVA